MTPKSATKSNVKEQPPLAQVSCSVARLETPRTDAKAITPSKGNKIEPFVDADFARQLERELTITNQTCEQHAKDAVRLQHENSVLYAFINREMKMTASDPRITKLANASLN